MAFSLSPTYRSALLKAARKAYPVSMYGDATDEQLLRWIAEDIQQDLLLNRKTGVKR